MLYYPSAPYTCDGDDDDRDVYEDGDDDVDDDDDDYLCKIICRMTMSHCNN